MPLRDHFNCDLAISLFKYMKLKTLDIEQLSIFWVKQNPYIPTLKGGQIMIFVFSGWSVINFSIGQNIPSGEARGFLMNNMF